VGYLVAPNGTGKSTFLRAAVDLIPAGWQTRRLGAPGDPGGSVRYAAGPMLPPQVRLSDVLALFAARRHLGPATAAAVETWGLGPVLDRRCGELSEGDAHAAVLALACVGTPGALVLDEPARALDHGRRGVLVEELRRATTTGAAALIVEHDGWVRSEVGGEVCRDA
jgi:ABC-2 type transport system ATP-binding protein